MFPSMFGHDPFSNDPLMEMMSGRRMGAFPSPLFSSPFMNMHTPGGLLQLENGLTSHHHHAAALHQFPPSPFAGMMESMQNMQTMQNMQNMQRSMMSSSSFPGMVGGLGGGAGGHSFQSSTVIMHNNGDGPRVIQSSASARVGPDGVKETRKSHKDSGTGEMTMSIGHHINDRAHVIEKSKNRRTGDQEEKQEYINLEEEEAGAFNSEWMRKMSSSVPRHHHRAIHHPGMSRHEPYTRHHPNHRSRRPQTAIAYRPIEHHETTPADRPTEHHETTPADRPTEHHETTPAKRPLSSRREIP